MLHFDCKQTDDIYDFSKFDPDDWEEFKKHISYKVVNQKTVSDKDNVVHKDLMDLSIVCILTEVLKNNESVLTYEITKQDVEDFGSTEEEILEIAKENVSKSKEKRINTFKEHQLSDNALFPLLKLPREVSLGFPSSHDGETAFIQDTTKDHDNVIIVTNKYNIYGASYMFDPDTLQEIHRRFKSNFYIIPSSVHEIMCVSDDYVKQRDKSQFETEDDLLDMLFQMNSDNRDVENVLTYRIYKYLADEGHVLFSIKQRS